MYARSIQVQAKVHLKILQFLVLMYDKGFTLCFRSCPNGNGLFSPFKQFLESEMSKSPPIIVRECIFKNQNLFFCVML